MSLKGDIMDKIVLDEKVVLIAGASSGMGRATAQYLAEAGCKVMVAARREENLKALVAEIVAAGGEADYVKLDVTSEEDCEKAVKATVEKYGRLDGVVNSAGAGQNPGGIEENFDSELMEHIMKIDFFGIHNMEKAAWPALRDSGGGSIVNVSSIAAFVNFETRCYSSAKAATIAMDRTTASLCGPLGIRVNTICPGPVKTEMTAEAFASEFAQQMYMKRMPMRRFGEAEDIAYMAAFLISDMSSWITGQAFNIDGGWTIKQDMA